MFGTKKDVVLNMQEEQKFARALANPVKSVRDKTVSELKKFLMSVEDMTDLDMLQLWKALFYCLWLADKGPVQEELCMSLANLLAVFKKLSFAFNKYLRLFFRTILREWVHLDQYRLNKFYTLVRAMINKSFVLLKESDWNSKSMSIFLDVIYTEVLRNPPNGPRFHLCDIYLPELLDVTGGSITSDIFVKLLEPFSKSICSTDDAVFHGRVSQRLFVDYTTHFAREKAPTGQADTTETPTVFQHVSSVRLQKVLFDLASGEDCLDRCALTTPHPHSLTVSPPSIGTAIAPTFVITNSLPPCYLTPPYPLSRPPPLLRRHRKRIYALHEAFQQLTRVPLADDEAVAKDDPQSSIATGASATDGPPTTPATKKKTKKNKKDTLSGADPEIPQKTKKEGAGDIAAEAVNGGPKSDKAKEISAAPPAVPPPQEVPKFVSSPKFAGAKPGYAFKKVSCGCWFDNPDGSPKGLLLMCTCWSIGVIDRALRE